MSFIGFGSFEPRARAARTGRNPKTGEALHALSTRSLRSLLDGETVLLVRGEPMPVLVDEGGFHVRHVERAVAKKWRLQDASIFPLRLKECDSKDFFESPKALARALETDWEFMLSEGRLRKLITPEGDDWRAEYDVVKDALRDEYALLARAFDSSLFGYL